MNQQYDDQTVRSWLRERRNWGRWGADDQRGAINLIDAPKRLQAIATVRTGEAVSLSRPLHRNASPVGEVPVTHEVHVGTWGSPDAGYAHDQLTLDFHHRDVTHIDALCHLWDSEGTWGGRPADEVVHHDGARWADIDQWREGIVTRGVLADMPAYFGREYVSDDRPVHGDDLAAALARQGGTVEPGDALVVFSGRQAWEDATRHTWTRYPPVPRPGLHASCLPFIRDHDIALLVWDQMDATPSGFDVPWTVHGALQSFGVALLDGALLEPLAQRCREQGRYEFMLVVAPLRITGGTGSPVNPIALL